MADVQNLSGSDLQDVVICNKNNGAEETVCEKSIVEPIPDVSQEDDILLGTKTNAGNTDEALQFNAESVADNSKIIDDSQCDLSSNKIIEDGNFSEAMNVSPNVMDIEDSSQDTSRMDCNEQRDSIDGRNEEIAMQVEDHTNESCSANAIAEDETSMNASEAGEDHSVDMQHEFVQLYSKDRDSMSVTQSGEESMEVASPNDEDPIASAVEKPTESMEIEEQNKPGEIDTTAGEEFLRSIAKSSATQLSVESNKVFENSSEVFVNRDKESNEEEQASSTLDLNKSIDQTNTNIISEEISTNLTVLANDSVNKPVSIIEDKAMDVSSSNVSDKVGHVDILQLEQPGNVSLEGDDSERRSESNNELGEGILSTSLGIHSQSVSSENDLVLSDQVESNSDKDSCKEQTVVDELDDNTGSINLVVSSVRTVSESDCVTETNMVSNEINHDLNKQNVPQDNQPDVVDQADSTLTSECEEFLAGKDPANVNDITIDKNIKDLVSDKNVEDVGKTKNIEAGAVETIHQQVEKVTEDSFGITRDPTEFSRQNAEGTNCTENSVSEPVTSENRTSVVSEQNLLSVSEVLTTNNISHSDLSNLHASDKVTAEPSETPTGVQAEEDIEICIVPDSQKVMKPVVENGPENGIEPLKKKIGRPRKSLSVVSPTTITTSTTTTTTTNTTTTDLDDADHHLKETPSKDGAQRPCRRAAKRAEQQIKELAEDADSNDGNEEDKTDKTWVAEEMNDALQLCINCWRLTNCKFRILINGKQQFICQEGCFGSYREKKKSLIVPSTPAPDSTPQNTAETSFVRKCAQCSSLVTICEKNLSWETMDFCNEECLGKYQTHLGSHCANCKNSVQSSSLGKYCVRFGNDVKQFCCSTCLEEFKKGLKVCSYCQKDISGGTEGFLAPVGDKGQFKDFCTQACMEKYDQMSNNLPPPVVVHQCAVCNNEKVVKVEVIMNGIENKLCSEPCFAAFKFVNALSADQCNMCKKYFDKSQTDDLSVFYDESPLSFCCRTCMNVYILANRKIVPCNWCKVKKYNFDMIKRLLSNGQVLMMCSLNCLALYQVSVNAVSAKRIKCDMCSAVAQAQYHLTMSDASIRNFCSYPCVMQFQNQYNKATPLTLGNDSGAPIPTGAPKKAYSKRLLPQNENQAIASKPALPVISSVTSLAENNRTSPVQNEVRIAPRPTAALKVNNNDNTIKQSTPPQVVVKQQILVRQPPPKSVKNKCVMTKPIQHTKGVSCKPKPYSQETQTDESMGKPTLIPVPVPIYVPVPMHMYSLPYPVPVPFPLPIPVPMFIPTTRNSAKGIMKEIKRIQDKIPTDPFEAELLMMAEMVAGEKKASASDSDTDIIDTGDASEAPDENATADGDFSPEPAEANNAFGDDMLQMALKMASELDEPPVDLEAALTPSTITAQSQSSVEHNDVSDTDPDDPDVVFPEPKVTRNRKRPLRGRGGGNTAKRGKRGSTVNDISSVTTSEHALESEKPDANMLLKYTFGVYAWRRWVQQKNSEIEKAVTSNRKLKKFKTEILQLTSDELNYALCLFVKEVRKPDGSEYPPDVIYYLCLGIQQYLFENGRIDNIFTDAYFEKFTECLDEVAKKFSSMFLDAKTIITRVEEEHLWESKQLGAHSPHVLLSTLMFFNTKYFNLTNVDEHMQLSFSHIMKHWKRNPGVPANLKIPGVTRNVLLRFYPPQNSTGNSRKKKVYEQQENEDNPLRCPVKLYEFYLSKCPESVKTRNDVFYLLPERSCVPDSPVWYSTIAIGKEQLMKMLHRIKMVKEIQESLASAS